MPPEASIQSVMRQRVNLVAAHDLHSSDESSAGFEVRNRLAAVVCMRALLPSSRRC